MASKSLAVRSLFYEERQKRGSSGLGVSFLLDFLTGMVLCKDTETKKSIFSVLFERQPSVSVCQWSHLAQQSYQPCYHAKDVNRCPSHIIKRIQ